MPLIDPIEDPQVNEDGSLQNEEPQEERPQESALPEKFRNKSAAEIAEMYLNLEKDHGRLANEVGDTRKLVDRVLDLQANQQPSRREEEPEDDFNIDATDLLNDPKGTLEKVLARREAKLQEAYEARIRQIEGHLGVQQLQSKHGDFQQITNDPEFLDFVKGNPYRAKIAQEAVQNGDVGAVDYLITEWKDRHPAAPQEEEVRSPGKDPLQRAREASLEGSGSGESRSSGKVYSRQALIRMKLQDPEAYGDPAFQAEILKAYNEGRVK